MREMSALDVPRARLWPASVAVCISPVCHIAAVGHIGFLFAIRCVRIWLQLSCESESKC